MFGKNPQLKQNLTAGGSLSVVGIFPTIQGEGPWAGFPATFIRVAGCNLACSWCDTEFTLGAADLTLEEILDEADRVGEPYAIRRVVITGGEPFRQNIVPLIELLIHSGYAVQIETAGTLSLADAHFLWDDVTVVVSPKTGKVHPDFIDHADEVHWKYILRKGEIGADGLPVVSPQTGRPVVLARPSNLGGDNIYVQACDEHDTDATRANIEETARVAMTHGYRYSHQLHKVIGLE